MNFCLLLCNIQIFVRFHFKRFLVFFSILNIYKYFQKSSFIYILFLSFLISFTFLFVQLQLKTLFTYNKNKNKIQYFITITQQQRYQQQQLQKTTITTTATTNDNMKKLQLQNLHWNFFTTLNTSLSTLIFIGQWQHEKLNIRTHIQKSTPTTIPTATTKTINYLLLLLLLHFLIANSKSIYKYMYNYTIHLFRPVQYFHLLWLPVVYMLVYRV